MAYPDVELELQVLRVNVSGIRGDVRDMKARVHTRCDRLQQLIEQIDERLTALELRYCCRALEPLISRKAS